MRIFIGSSRESLEVARIVATHLELIPNSDIKVLVWDTLEQELFAPGEFTLESLEKIAHDVDAALFIFAEDDKMWWRDEEVGSVRDNVLFEYGLFAGVLSRKRVAIVKIGNPKQISDLKGLNYIHYDPNKQNIAQRRLETWFKNVCMCTPLETQGSISVMSFLDALNYAIKSAPFIGTLKVFAISTTFSVKVFRAESSLKINDAYIFLRRYQENDPYFNIAMENAIANSIGSWEKLKEYKSSDRLHIGYFNYHPDEGFFLIDDRILIYGILNTYENNIVEFDQKVIVVKNTSAVGRDIITLYKRRFDQLKKLFMAHE